MDEDQKRDLNLVLLEWARLQYALNDRKQRMDALAPSLEEIAARLTAHEIAHVETINQSQDYYTIKYTKGAQAYIKQFTSEEVEQKS